MKATDLRIGNIVRFSRGVDAPVTILNINDFDMGYVDLQPVPLTEEWLLKFGFTRVVNQLKGDWTKADFYLCFDVDNDCYFYYGSEKITKYVHQLQNLFFVLTGEELTIK